MVSFCFKKRFQEYFGWEYESLVVTPVTTVCIVAPEECVDVVQQIPVMLWRVALEEPGFEVLCLCLCTVLNVFWGACGVPLLPVPLRVCNKAS